MIIVGLTGGIATGKSTVGELFEEDYGARRIDADQVSRYVVQPGMPALKAIVDAYGADVLQSDGTLDRAALRSLVFASPAARKELEAITHPAIRQEIARRIALALESGVQVTLVEAALLVETGTYKIYPELFVVTCEPATQLLRIQQRDGVSEEAAAKIIAAQMPTAEKEAVATRVIRNDGDLNQLRREVQAAWDDLASRYRSLNRP